MRQFEYNYLWIFIFICIMINHIEMVSTSDISQVKLSDLEVRYLTERLKKHENMCDYDIRYTIIELEHFYTAVKNSNNMYEPSAMMDKAWHHHILNTKMYRIFSRRHFAIEILHHIPFWSGVDEQIENLSDGNQVLDSIETYHTLVSIFGSENINKTVWFMKENKFEDGQLETRIYRILSRIFLFSFLNIFNIAHVIHNLLNQKFQYLF